MKRLDELLPDGEAFQEWPIATTEGIRQADVVWASAERQREMEETGDPPTIAPEICVEVMSEANDLQEMKKKRQLYLDSGSEEVWVVTEKGNVRFFAEEELDVSQIVPEFPDQI